MRRDTHYAQCNGMNDAQIESTEQSSRVVDLVFIALSVSAIVMDVGYNVLMDVSHNVIVPHCAPKCFDAKT